MSCLTDPSITTSNIWHGDLHAENIFVNPDRPFEVAGIIDWQAIDLVPLFDHERQPYFLDYDGPRLKGLERPELPENFEELDLAERDQAKSLYLKMSLSALYRTLTHEQNNRLYRAMEFHFSSDEIAAVTEDVNGAIRGIEHMQHVKGTVGDLWPEKGIVRHDQYDDAKEALRLAKQRTIDQFACNEQERAVWAAAWPFDD